MQNYTSLSESITPCFHLTCNLFDTNAPITEIVYTEKNDEIHL